MNPKPHGKRVDSKIRTGNCKLNLKYLEEQQVRMELRKWRQVKIKNNNSRVYGDNIGYIWGNSINNNRLSPAS